MSKILRWCQTSLLVLLLLIPTGFVQAAPNFLPVSEIKAGMHGIAKTVVTGTQIEEFGVEVLGVMKNKGLVGDLILVRTYGDVIERTGGIAQGMSGSPVYIDGKLVGAIAYGWALTDHRIAMVTPIADMLKIWEQAAAKDKAEPATESASQDKAGSEAKPEAEATPGSKDKAEPEAKAEVEDKAEADSKAGSEAESGPEEKAETGNETKPADKSEPEDKPIELAEEEPVPVATPLMAAGFSDAALAMLTEKLAPLNLVPYAVGGSPGEVTYGSIEPGSTIGVELVRGDVSLGVLGTVTYVEGDKILAFGHPFLKRGPSNYFLNNAYVFTVVNSINNSFMVGAMGDLIGTVDQDRGAGIGGVLSRYPSVIPVRISVTDKDNNNSQTVAVQIVNDEQLVPVLAATTVYNAIDKTMDRTGEGTARITFTIRGRNMPGKEISRENMFYSPANVGQQAVSELLEALTVIAGNQFNPVDIMDVKVDVSVEQQRRTATILEARPNVAVAKPGDTVNITVKLKPYRGEPITRVVPYTVPSDQPEGPLTLAVRGGGMVPLSQLILAKQGLGEEVYKLERSKHQSFSEVLNEFKHRDRNNDIVVEIMAGDMGGLISPDEQTVPKIGANSQPQPAPKLQTEPSFKPSILAKSEAENGTKRGKAFITTDYIIEGDTQVLLNIRGQV